MRRTDQHHRPAMERYWTAILATVFLVVGAGLELASAELGFGMHFWDVDVRNATKLLQMFYVVE
ncbi:hypothetical protein JX266_014582, partial [Neoarthrinium moseri]